MNEIQAQQLFHQHLTAPADCVTAARDLCGFQAQFFSNALHSLKIRSGTVDDVFVRRAFVKSWTLRGTMHLFPLDDLPLFFYCGRKNHLRPCDTLDADEWITRERKRYFADCILEAVKAGTGEREALKMLCRKQGMTAEEERSIFNSWGGTLRALCENGKLCYLASEEKAFRLCPSFEPMNEEEAWHEMLMRYFSNYGPAAVKDAAYFFGTSVTQIKRRMEKLPLVHSVYEGREYWTVKAKSDTPQPPRCIFLAGFDPLLMGYEKTESLYLPREYLRHIFLLSGIVMPAILFDGRIVGKWKRAGKGLKITLFEAVHESDRKIILSSAEELWNDVTRIEFE